MRTPSTPQTTYLKLDERNIHQNYEHFKRKESMKLKVPWISLVVIVFLFPSVCLSEVKTIQGEYCDVYSGDMKDKEELGKFRKTVRKKSVEDGIYKITKSSEGHFSNKCIGHVVKNYLQKIVVVSHTFLLQLFARSSL